MSTIPLTTGVSINITNVPLLDEDNTDSIEVGSKVTVASPKGENNIRQTDFTPDSNGATSLYVNNNSGAGTEMMMGSVTTAPGSDGLLGAVTLYTAATSTTAYSDGATVDEKVYNVRFINIDPRAIETGDPVIVAKLREDGSTFRLVCSVLKATFSNNPFSTS